MGAFFTCWKNFELVALNYVLGMISLCISCTNTRVNHHSVGGGASPGILII